MKLPKGIVITCWVIIIIWLTYKFVQISKGYLLSELDFSNPSIMGILGTVSIILLVISGFSKNKLRFGPEITIKNKDSGNIERISLEKWEKMKLMHGEDRYEIIEHHD